MRSLAISATVGILVGLVVGRFVLLLPPAGAIAVTLVGSTAVFTWAFYSLRKLREQERVIKDSMKRLREWR